MAPAEMWIRALHVLFALLWAGGGVFRGVVVDGIARRDETFRDRFYAGGLHGPFLGVTATLAVLFGSIRLVMGAGDPGQYDMEALGGGFFLFHGALGLATAAFLIGLALHMPTDTRLKHLARARLAGADHDEAGYGRLVRRDAVLGKVSAVLVTLALLGMVSFRAAA